MPFDTWETPSGELTPRQVPGMVQARQVLVLGTVAASILVVAFPTLAVDVALPPVLADLLEGWIAALKALQILILGGLIAVRFLYPPYCRRRAGEALGEGADEKVERFLAAREGEVCRLPRAIHECYFQEFLVPMVALAAFIAASSGLGVLLSEPQFLVGGGIATFTILTCFTTRAGFDRWLRSLVPPPFEKF